MGQPSILVIDGNRAATRAQQVAAGGEPSGEGYAQVLKRLAAVSCDIVRPADGEVRFASGAGLASYDGVAITGSALNVYDGGAHRSEEHTSELQSQSNLVCRLLLGKKKNE